MYSSLKVEVLNVRFSFLLNRTISKARTFITLCRFLIHIEHKAYIHVKQYYSMPIITISTYSGRPQREKDRLAEAITEDVIRIFSVDKNEVIIVFHEEPHGNWYAEGIRL